MVLETWGRFAHVRKVCVLYVYVHVWCSKKKSAQIQHERKVKHQCQSGWDWNKTNSEYVSDDVGWYTSVFVSIKQLKKN